jgi:exopolysaccharide biosynthesis polyprenyl glycosylphosphotransferase
MKDSVEHTNGGTLTAQPLLSTPQKTSALSLRFSERRVLLMFVDLLLVNGALVIFTLLPIARTRDLELILGNYVTWLAVLSVLWLVVGHLFNVYSLERAANALESAWTSGGAALLTIGLYYLIPLLTPGLPTRRSHVIILPVLAAISVVLWRLIYAKVFSQPIFSRRALVVGAGHSARALLHAISDAKDNQARERAPGHGYEILGFLDDDAQKQGQSIEGVPILGGSGDLLQLANALRPDELIISITNMHAIQGDLFRAILDSREMGIHVTTMLDLYEQITGRVPVAFAGQNLQTVLPTKQPGSRRFYLFLRRIFDFVVSGVGCIFLGLLIPFVWLGNRFTDPGDLFYRQERVGEGGKPFYVIKFRSMVMDAEKFSGAVWAEKDDPRITPIGRILRKLRLDEVPQFWNVLKGEMSFIGPRPERPYFVDRLSEEIPFYRIRHAIKPGITGWAQVNYRYGASVEDALAKLEYDLYYIKHQNLYLDFQTLLKTIQVVLGLRGR